MTKDFTNYSSNPESVIEISNKLSMLRNKMSNYSTIALIGGFFLFWYIVGLAFFELALHIYIPLRSPLIVWEYAGFAILIFLIIFGAVFYTIYAKKYHTLLDELKKDLILKEQIAEYLINQNPGSIGRISDILRDLQSQTGAKFALTQINSSNLSEKREALSVLLEMDSIDEMVMPSIVQILTNPEELLRTRERAAQILQKSRWNSGDINEMAWYYLALKDWDNLIKLGNVAVKPLIISIMQTEEVKEGPSNAPNDVRVPMAKALGKLKNTDTIEPLENLLSTLDYKPFERKQNNPYKAVQEALDSIRQENQSGKDSNGRNLYAGALNVIRHGDDEQPDN